MRRGQNGFGSVLDAIYYAAGDTASWPHALRQVADYLGASGGMLVRQANGTGGQMTIDRLDPELSALYLDHYTDNAFSRGLAVSKPGHPVAASALADMREIRRTAFHADILAPQRIDEVLAMPHAAWRRDGEVGGVAFVLCPRGAERSADALRHFRRIAPHLTRALDLAPLFACRRSGLESALSLWPGPVLLCDETQRVVYANPAMEQLAREGDGLTIARGSDRTSRMRPARDNEARALTRMLQQACETSRGKGESAGGTMRVSRPSGRASYLLCVTPLPRVPTLWADAGELRTLVFVLDPQPAVPRGLPEAIRDAFGLTPAEAKVAAIVGRGTGIPSASAWLAVSPETVRRQVQACFAKTGVGSQAELARLVALLPALDPPGR